MNILDWPLECAQASVTKQQQWFHAGSNLCLDFHGDPLHAKLVVYSDGNHHMALLQAVQEFLQQCVQVKDVFYATTPPGVLVNALQQGSLLLGNLTISAKPNIFIGPESILNNLVKQKIVQQHKVFIKSQGNVLLVVKNNPLNITTVEDLLRDDVCLFLSNPHAEKASYNLYREFLVNALQQAGLTQYTADSINIFHGSVIHHREAPQAVFDRSANVAVLYYHLALRYCRIFPDLFDMVELLPLNHALNPVTEYVCGIVGEGGEYGEQFFNYMQSEQVQTIYQQHGLKII